MSTLRNEIILASAGTGKTFALSDRIVRLLALGARPESIVALTFTRKAAGEFTSAVFRKLSDAALDPEVAAHTALRLELKDTGCAEFQAILERMVRDMDRLAFGTLDSFFQRIAGSIPLELGLAGPVALLDEHSAAEAQEQTLRELVRPDPRRARAQKALLDAFRDATWGVEEKQLLPRLLRFVETCHALYLASPEAARWGLAGTIWPDGCRWLPFPQSVTDEAAAILEWAAGTDGQFARAIGTFAESVLAWEPGGKIPETAVAKRLIEIFAAGTPEGALEIPFGRGRQALPEALTAPFERVVRHLIGGTIGYALVSASGIHRILAEFDRTYEETVRMTGRLGFSDVIELLRHADSQLWQERLNGRLEHWLFDEFQDTNIAQWRVLENLVDEVLQDVGGGRSVFFVGDPKQAIYRWRGGEHRLLGQLARKYHRFIEVRTLAESHRSTQPVIDFVNVIGETINLAATLPVDVRDEWRESWTRHASALKGPGHVTVSDAGNAEAMIDGFLEILHRVEPLRRGMTCAILTRTNKEASSIAHALRTRGFLDVAAEADVPVAIDNPVNRALLALFSAAAHPMDRGSQALVEMSPMRGWIESKGGWEGARRWIFDRWTRDGAERTVRAILEGADPPAAGDGFSPRRIEQFLELARNFDQGGDGSIDTFIRAATQNVRRDVASSGRVQVMTTHKAKGLGFDLVLLVVDDSTRIDSLPAGGLLLTGRDSAQLPLWILRRVSENAANADEALARVLRTERSEAAYEALCLLYVGVTRAKQGLHIFVGKATNDEGLSPNGLVRTAMARLSPDAELPWAMGDAEWYRTRTPLVEIPSRASAFARPGTWLSRVRVEPLRPSRPEEGSSRTWRLDSRASRAGGEVHAAFASIEWIAAAGMEAWSWPDERVREEVCRCLENPRIAEWFRGGEGIRVWRERSFDAWVGNQWISGIFDRVVLREDRAVLMDFKTDRGDATAALERHRPQLDLYRRALARLTGLPTWRISTFLVHVPSGAAVELTGDP